MAPWGVRAARSSRWTRCSPSFGPPLGDEESGSEAGSDIQIVRRQIRTTWTTMDDGIDADDTTGRRNPTDPLRPAIPWWSSATNSWRPISTALSRRIKRALQDSQNELLDRLRKKGTAWSPDLLPPETEHLDSLTTAALPFLEEAADAGGTLVKGKAKRPSTDALLGVATELAESIVRPAASPAVRGGRTRGSRGGGGHRARRLGIPGVEG